MGLQHPALKEWGRCQAHSASQRKQAWWVKTANIHSGYPYIQRGVRPWTKYMLLQDAQQKDNSDNQKKNKKAHSDWALGQAVSAELHLGRFSNWTGGGPEQPDQPWKQCCFKQDTGPGEHPHHLNVPWLYYTPNAKSYWRHGHLISIIHTKDRQTDNHIVNTTSCARLENMNLWRMWGESLGCPKLEQPNS